MKILFFLLLTTFNLTYCKISCRDENGSPIDWFYLYKFPTLPSNQNLYVQNGTGYGFIHSNNVKWTYSSFSINDTRSLPALALNSLYEAGDMDDLEKLGIGYIFYNDQFDNVTVIKGHTKGILVFDNDTAIWIIHSFPHYPPKINNKHYFIYHPQLLFGQSMFCLTLNFDSLESIGKQFLYNWPQIYDFYVPTSLVLTRTKILNNLLMSIQGVHYDSEPFSSITTLQSISGTSRFISFAKAAGFQRDLYTDLVAPSLQSDLNVETWNNGRGTLASNCTLDYHVFNIELISFDTLNVSFSVHHDHSKWALSTNQNKLFVCIGDINRQVDQYKRGGGTLCLINNNQVWSEYKNLIKQVDDC